MNDININEIVKIETLPKIFEQLEKIGELVDKKLKGIENIECNEENKQEVKEKRIEINKTLEMLENKRIEIKKSIEEPYNLFNSKYEETTKLKLQNASNMLKEKIDYIETQQKLQKEMELREFAFEYINANNLQPVVKFDDFNLNITLSASMKSLKDQIIKYIEKVNNDMELIKMEEYSNEIFVEYCKTHDFVNSKKIVIQRHEEINKISEKETQLQINDNAEIVEAVEEVIAPVEIEEKIKVAFTITATKNQIRKLKTWLESEEIEYA